MEKVQIPDYQSLMGKKIHVKLVGGRESEGILRGYDQTGNVILDDCTEFLRDPRDATVLTDKTRKLGTTVVRSQNVITIYDAESAIEIPNPFL
ncbi:putative U6 snRNA-associated protein [Blattamonas nauphoetae]|uniref:U6 snRNA-associated protein n=1 Tax=Blattamonas nauphoetae TaxID=2049346 RepID=A0ABQ9Y4B8_9EUKA|nr:putative U6 snRNA-associated protein [Blattamonas nauphoetae]